MRKIVLPDMVYNRRDEVVEICKPLTNLGINTFIYIRNYRNGKIIHLSNRYDWLDFFYKNRLYLYGPFENINLSYPTGLTLWNRLPGRRVFDRARDGFDIYDGFTIVEHAKDGSEEYYSFGFNRNLVGNMGLVLNEISLIKRFILYFKNRAKQLLTLASNNKIVLPNRNSDNRNEDVIALDMNKKIFDNHKKIFADEIKLTRYLVEEPQMYVTNQELMVIFYIMRNYTNNKIAQELNISHRTVETHLNNIKRKLNCFSRRNLCKTLHRVGLNTEELFV